MKYFFLLVILLGSHAFAHSEELQNVDYTREDSVKVANLLVGAKRQKASTNWMVYFGKKFVGVPYVAKTLEKNKTERLVVNLRQLDCTTFVETTLALTLCAKNNKASFADFCRYLRLVRYRQGNVSYPSRLHYFTQWIDDNTQLGYVREVSSQKKPFVGIQTLNVNYMSTHVSQYPMLVGNPKALDEIAQGEKKLCGRKYRYIPKSTIANNDMFRKTIHDGDIIVILTSKKGLDTSHIGIAVWKSDGLHLLNASSLRHKVVVEPKLLRTYMMGQKSQIGIRVVTQP